MSGLEQIDLSSVKAKLGRAHEHLQALTGGIHTFMESQAHDISIEHNADFTKYVARAHFAFPANTVRWGLILGDYVHCLRSALDHLVYAVAVCEAQADPPPNHDKLMMPIKSTQQGWDANAYRLASLSDPVRARIESLQPLPGRDENVTFALLDQLDVRDKHRILSVMVMQPNLASTRIIGAPPDCEPPLSSFETGPIENGAPIVWVTFDRPAPDVKVETDASLSVVIRDSVLTDRRYNVLQACQTMQWEVGRAINVVLGGPPREPHALHVGTSPPEAAAT